MINNDNEYDQLCVMQGTTLGDKTKEDFEKWMKQTLNVRVKFAEEVITNGSVEREEEGGRHDLLFYVHNDDITASFCTERFKVGIRWWEDVVVFNDGSYLYTQEVLDKYPPAWGNEPMTTKPILPINLDSEQGNIFSVMAMATKLLKGTYKNEESKRLVNEMTEKVHKQKSYKDALNVINEYVEIQDESGIYE